VCVNGYAFIKGVCKGTCQLGRLGKTAYPPELEENSCTFLPAMPLISWIRPQKITALPQTAFVSTLALTKLRTAAAHIIYDKQRGRAQAEKVTKKGGKGTERYRCVCGESSYFMNGPFNMHITCLSGNDSCYIPDLMIH